MRPHPGPMSGRQADGHFYQSNDWVGALTCPPLRVVANDFPVFADCPRVTPFILRYRLARRSCGGGSCLSGILVDLRTDEPKSPRAPEPSSFGRVTDLGISCRQLVAPLVSTTTARKLEHRRGIHQSAAALS